jgi:hypothetical protein
VIGNTGTGVNVHAAISVLLNWLLDNTYDELRIAPAFCHIQNESPV